MENLGFVHTVFEWTPLLLISWWLFLHFRNLDYIEKSATKLMLLQQRLDDVEGMVKSMVERLEYIKKSNTTAIKQLEDMLEWPRDQGEQLQKQAHRLDQKMGELVRSVRDMHMKLAELTSGLQNNQGDEEGPR